MGQLVVKVREKSFSIHSHPRQRNKIKILHLGCQEIFSLKLFIINNLRHKTSLYSGIHPQLLNILSRLKMPKIEAFLGFYAIFGIEAEFI